MESRQEQPVNLLGNYGDQFRDIVQKLNNTRRQMWEWDYASASRRLVDIHDEHGEILDNARSVVEQLRQDRKNVDTDPEVDGEELGVNTSEERLFRKLARSRKTAFQGQPNLSLYLLGELTREVDRLAEQVLGTFTSFDEKKLKEKPALNLLASTVEGAKDEIDELDTWEEKSHEFQYRVRRSGTRTVEVRATREDPMNLSVEEVQERFEGRVGLVNTLGMEEGDQSESEEGTKSEHLRFRVVDDLALFDFAILDDNRVQGEVLPFESINDLDIIDEVFEALSG